MRYVKILDLLVAVLDMTERYLNEFIFVCCLCMKMKNLATKRLWLSWRRRLGKWEELSSSILTKHTIWEG